MNVLLLQIMPFYDCFLFIKYIFWEMFGNAIRGFVRAIKYYAIDKDILTLFTFESFSLEL